MDPIRALTVPTERRRRLGLPTLATELVDLPVEAGIIQACSNAMHNLGGPKLAQLGVSSAVRGEGRTTVATAIALVQAREYGRSALLLDLDFERPGVAGTFGFSAAPGVAEVLAELADFKEALHDVGDGLSIMTAGAISGPPARIASKLLASRLLAQLKSEFDVIVADLPALKGSPCGALLPEAFEDHLLVVRAASTPASAVRSAVESLNSDPMVILNGTESRLPPWLARLLDR